MPTAPGPLKHHWYLMLVSLSAGHRHGLAIARDVREFSGGRVTLWPAMLYGSLEDLCDAGWVEEIQDAARRPDDNERKRYYGITRAGRAALAAETNRLADLVELARSVNKRARA